MHSVRFVFALHNHQPMGNFDGVFEANCRDSYLPFLELIEGFPQIPVSLHASGCLMEWLVEHRPEYIERLKALVARGQVEILGGGFYEPILPMIPAADRRGQIAQYTGYLQRLLDCKVRGMWVPERVWEQTLVSDIVAAGIEYTVLDDFHFKCAGLSDEQLFGYYLTEDEGRLLKIFPNSERLRYLVPWKDPEETIAYAHGLAEQRSDVLLVCADDGEKFGGWPETHKHVFQEGWLRRLFDALVREQAWLNLSTFGQTVDETPPIGKIYLPDSSYREMTEWALPVQQLAEYEAISKEMEQDPRWPRLRPFVRGGFWRNFKAKYPETDEMYARMLEVSRRLQEIDPDNPESPHAVNVPVDPEAFAEARRELYRGQCNCSYWHGAFGGLYLPHLRNAVFSHLIAADTAAEEASGRTPPWVEAQAADFNLDARQEIRLANDKLVAYLAPAQGGQLYELDIRAVPLNLVATLTRRPEPYHAKIAHAAGQPNSSDAGPTHQLRVKQADLDQRLVYDPYRRRSLIDHFFSPDVTLADVAACRAVEQGDFLAGIYERPRVRRNPDRVQVVMARTGQVGGHAIRMSKSVTLSQESSALEVRYTLEDVPKDFPFHFAVELAFVGLAAGAPDRYLYSATEPNLGQLQSQLDLQDIDLIGLVDGWLGLDVAMNLSRPAGVWTFPIDTVSQSEGGFELVHQSTTVIPRWPVRADARGRWTVELTLALDTTAAEARRHAGALA
jgi:alpha-amylase